MTGPTIDVDAFADCLPPTRCSSRAAAIGVARAPGRLDVMGGIADYSGSLVLQRPIAEATWAASSRIDRPVLDIVSLGRPPLTIPLETLAPDGVPIGYDQARRHVRRRRVAMAALGAYVAGVLLVLARERGCRSLGPAHRGVVTRSRKARA